MTTEPDFRSLADAVRQVKDGNVAQQALLESLLPILEDCAALQGKAVALAANVESLRREERAAQQAYELAQAEAGTYAGEVRKIRSERQAELADLEAKIKEARKTLAHA